MATKYKVNLKDTFGRLTVIRKETKNKHVLWTCQCDCGRTLVASASELASGTLLSCGCSPYRAKTTKTISTEEAWSNGQAVIPDRKPISQKIKDSLRIQKSIDEFLANGNQITYL